MAEQIKGFRERLNKIEIPQIAPDDHPCESPCSICGWLE